MSIFPRVFSGPLSTASYNIPPHDQSYTSNGMQHDGGLDIVYHQCYMSTLEKNEKVVNSFDGIDFFTKINIIMLTVGRQLPKQVELSF